MTDGASPGQGSIGLTSGRGRKPRPRELGIVLGALEPGPHNAITDVPGVQVGHVTIIDDGSGDPPRGPARTGVTVVLPHGGNLFREKVPAAFHVINGYGKAAGSTQVQELGNIETPIALTNTLSIGAAFEGLVRHALAVNPDIGRTAGNVNPVVAECSDARLNDIRALVVRPGHVTDAIAAATDGPVTEGSVGAGTGMVCYGWKGGIGTASRTVPTSGEPYLTGVLVLANFGRARELRIAGVPVGESLRPPAGPAAAAPEGGGSCVVILATSAPADSRQLGRLARRAQNGLARTGTPGDHGSGDYVIAFSTARRIPHVPAADQLPAAVLPEDGPLLDVLFQAVTESTEEAVVSALLAAEQVGGPDASGGVPLPAAQLLARLGSVLRTGQPGNLGAMTDKATSDLWWKNGVIYCADVATWADSDGDGTGDLAGLTRRLDYLSGLGITTLWLMPFYPSPLGDDGYDITDYYAVDPRFGTLGDFVEMIRTASNLGIRVLVDLVLNHTSNQHPWFQQARRDRNSRYRDYYRWSDEKQREPSEVAFPGEQTSTWTYDDVAGQWYMHRYYDFMPELNITKPDVRDEMNKVLGFWLELGISGFRVDSLQFMIETVGTSSREQPVSYLRSLVEFLERRRGDAILLGEANVSPKDQQQYFQLDGGDGVQMLFDFRTCAAQWLAHARGSAEPIVRALGDRPAIPQQAQFANFCRHHDELNIGMLSKKERDEVFAAFAPEEEHRVYGRGIRRRLAPMLGNDPRRIRLALALTMALPGTPVLFYGDEIGMGEDLSLPGRLAVRGPMQWSSGQGGGFSPAAQPYRPARADGPYGYRKVNVAAQRHHPGSLHSWVAHASRILRECPELGWGDWHTLDVGDPRVLAIDYRWRDGHLVTLHNLSAGPAEIRLPAAAGGPGYDGDVRQVLGSDGPGTPGLGQALTLDGYGFRWLRLAGGTD